MKQEKCIGKYCRDSAVQRPISDTFGTARLTKRCNRCWRKEMGPESFKYQNHVTEDNRIKIEVPREVQTNTF